MNAKNEQFVRDSEIRANLWREFVSNYQRVLGHEPDRFCVYAEKFRDRYVHAR
jgi:hypothetical protein